MGNYMKTLYESILDTDKDIIKISKERAEIDTYIDYIVKHLGGYLNKAWAKSSDGTAIVFSVDQNCLNIYKKMTDRKFKGFVPNYLNNTNTYQLFLKRSTLCFEWNLFTDDSGRTGDLWLTCTCQQKDIELKNMQWIN